MYVYMYVCDRQSICTYIHTQILACRKPPPNTFLILLAPAINSACPVCMYVCMMYVCMMYVCMRTCILSRLFSFL